MALIEAILDENSLEVRSDTQRPAAQQNREDSLGQPSKNEDDPDQRLLEALRSDEETAPADEQDPDPVAEGPAPDDEIKNFAQLASTFDVSEADFLSAISVPGLHEGEEVPLSQALEEWRNPKDASRYPAVATEMHRLKTQETELNDAHTNSISLMRRHLQAMVAAVGTEDDIDWAKAREEMPPAEYMERKERFDKRRESFQNTLSYIENEEKGVTEKSELQERERLSAEAEALMGAMPAWRDNDKLKTAKEAMQRAAELVGLTKEQLNEFTDHRHILLLWKASEYDRYQGLLKNKLPGLKDLPRVSIRAGARRSTREGNAEKRMKVLAAHKNIGTQDSAAKAIEALMGDDF